MSTSSPAIVALVKDLPMACYKCGKDAEFAIEQFEKSKKTGACREHLAEIARQVADYRK
jgi:hypothetical protein